MHSTFDEFGFQYEYLGVMQPWDCYVYFLVLFLIIFIDDAGRGVCSPV